MRYDDILKGFMLWLLGMGLLAIMLFSCSPEFHFNRFQKKGGKVTCQGDTVIREITTTIKGKDGRIDTVKEKVPYIEYKTRWETRYKYKTQRDSIEVVKYRIKWKTKEEVKIKRITHKSNALLWFLLGVATPIGLYIIFVRLRCCDKWRNCN